MKKCPNCQNEMEYDWDNDIYRCLICTTVVQQLPRLYPEVKRRWCEMEIKTDGKRVMSKLYLGLSK